MDIMISDAGTLGVVLLFFALSWGLVSLADRLH
jgi:hypothetical protein